MAFRFFCPILVRALILTSPLPNDSFPLITEKCRMTVVAKNLVNNVKNMFLSSALKAR